MEGVHNSLNVLGFSKTCVLVTFLLSLCRIQQRVLESTDCSSTCKVTQSALRLSLS